MNIDKIIKLGIEAKLLHESETKEYIADCGVEVWISGQRGLDALENFATLIAEHEREACAKVADRMTQHTYLGSVGKAIRARGQA